LYFFFFFVAFVRNLHRANLYAVGEYVSASSVVLGSQSLPASNRTVFVVRLDALTNAVLAASAPVRGIMCVMCACVMGF